MEAVAVPIDIGTPEAVSVVQDGLLQRQARCVPASQLCTGQDPAGDQGERSRRRSQKPASRPPWDDRDSGGAGWDAPRSVLRPRRILRGASRFHRYGLSHVVARHISTLTPPPMPRLCPRPHQVWWIAHQQVRHRLCRRDRGPATESCSERHLQERRDGDHGQSERAC